MHFQKEKTNSLTSFSLKAGRGELTSVTLVTFQHSLSPEANAFESSTNKDNFVSACKNELRLRKKKRLLSTATIIYVQNIWAN